jgi:metal-sulfur cluster biosynthetic enzyme
MAGLNANPTLFDVKEERRTAEDLAREADPDERDPLDSLEIFDLISTIKDPEHPHTLGQLSVAKRELIKVDDERGRVFVHFTPTIPHCSMATLIGLCIRVKLLRSLPSRFKIDVNVTPGTHMSEKDVNKQLNDKERVAAALENDNLLRVVNQCLQGVVE